MTTLDDILDITALPDGRVTCLVTMDGFDQPVPVTVGKDEADPVLQQIWAAAVDKGIPAPTYPPRTAVLFQAEAAVNRLHADMLERVLGGATSAERDTWAVKEAAALAYVAGNASAGQAAMIEAEASGASVEPGELAGTIITKGEAYRQIVGTAAAFRARSKATVSEACSETTPIEMVQSAVNDALEAIQAEATQLIGALAPSS